MPQLSYHPARNPSVRPWTVFFLIKFIQPGRFVGAGPAPFFRSEEDTIARHFALEITAAVFLFQYGFIKCLQFSLDARSLASFDEARSAWVAEAGKYLAEIGSSAEDIRPNTGFSVKEEIVVEKVHPVLQPNRKIEELKQAFGK